MWKPSTSNSKVIQVSKSRSYVTNRCNALPLCFWSGFRCSVFCPFSCLFSMAGLLCKGGMMLTAWRWRVKFLLFNRCSWLNFYCFGCCIRIPCIVVFYHERDNFFCIFMCFSKKVLRIHEFLKTFHSLICKLVWLVSSCFFWFMLEIQASKVWSFAWVVLFWFCSLFVSFDLFRNHR